VQTGARRAHAPPEAGGTIVRLSDVDGRRGLFTLARHRCRMLDVTFSRDGTLLATASHDQTTHLLNIRLTAWQARLSSAGQERDPA
jgi:hypothetical protein